MSIESTYIIILSLNNQLIDRVNKVLTRFFERMPPLERGRTRKPVRYGYQLMARLGSSPQASTLSPCFSTTANSLSAMPLMPPGAGLPLQYRRFAGVQITREYRLTDMRALADPLDLRRQHHRRHGKTRFVKFAHGRLVDGAGAMQPLGCAVDRLEGVAFELGFTLHRIAPVGHLGLAQLAAGVRHAAVGLRQFPEISELIINIGAVLLGKQVGEEWSLVAMAWNFKRMAVNLEYSAAAFAKYQRGGIPVITDSPVKREKSLS